MMGRMAPPFITLLPSLARTVTGTGDALDAVALSGQQLTLGLPPVLVVQCDVTAVSGTTPSVTVTVQDSVDGGTNWNTVLTLTAQTTVSRQVGRLGLTAANWPFNPRRMRISYVISGTTPSLTFSVKAVLV